MRTQTNRGQPARPYLRSVARAKTIDAGFLLGVQQPDAKAQLAAQESVSLEESMPKLYKELDKIRKLLGSDEG